MESTKFNSKPYFNDKFVRQVRNNFLSELTSSQSNDSIFDLEDIVKLKTDDWFIRRFLVEKPSTTVEMAVSKLQDCFEWRKEFGVSQLHDHMFPAEYYKLGGIFPYQEDRDGNTVFIIRVRLNQRHSTIPNNAQVELFSKKFIIHLLEKVITQHPNRKIGLIVDFQKATFANADLKIARFLTAMLSNYYYDVITWGCLFEMPWLLSKIWLIIQGWLSDDIRGRIKFATRDNITDFIEAKNLPHFMGGTCNESFRNIPDGVPDFEEWVLRVRLIADPKQARSAKEFLNKLSEL